MSLVDYGSSDDEDGGKSHEVTEKSSFVQRDAVGRKTPALPEDFLDLYQVNPRRGDDPEFHQGRVRGHNHVSGEWPTHIYLDFWPSMSMRETLEQELHTINANTSVSFRSFLTSELGVDRELHISLSKPLMLSTEEKDDVLADLMAITSSPLTVVFNSLDVFLNEDRTREFLVMKILDSSTAAIELLSSGINNVLQKYKLPSLYDKPQFHASIAWRQHPASSASLAKEGLHLGTIVPRLAAEKVMFHVFKIKIGKEIATRKLDRCIDI